MENKMCGIPSSRTFKQMQKHRDQLNCSTRICLLKKMRDRLNFTRNIFHCCKNMFFFGRLYKVVSASYKTNWLINQFD